MSQNPNLPDGCTVEMVDASAGCGDPLFCESCEYEADELKEHLGAMCCINCRPYCPECRDIPVSTRGEFCVPCALQAMGVEL